MMSLPLCRASSKMSIMPNGATQRSDTKVLLSLKRNTPGRSPFERRHVCPSQRVHSTQGPHLFHEAQALTHSYSHKCSHRIFKRLEAAHARMMLEGPVSPRCD